MFSDPLVLTRNYTTITADAALNLSFPCSERAADHSTYRANDSGGDEHTLRMAHQYGRTRNRFTFRYDVAGIASTIADPSLYAQASQSCYVVFDCPSSGPLATLAGLADTSRRQIVGVGSLLVSVAADPTLLTRLVVAGET